MKAAVCSLLAAACGAWALRNGGAAALWLVAVGPVLFGLWFAVRTDWQRSVAARLLAHADGVDSYKDTFTANRGEWQNRLGAR